MKDKKVLIFDFDGTLYSGEKIFELIPEFVQNSKRKMLPNLTDEQYEKVVRENPTWSDAWYGNDLAKHIYMLEEKYPEFNISIKDFLDWEASCLEPVQIDKSQVVDANFMKNLCETYTVYLVSNSLANHLKHYSKEIGINLSWFKGVMSNRFYKKDLTKRIYYKRILEKENIAPQNVYVFGDSNRSDLVPARELGINAFEVSNATKIPEIVKTAIK